MTIDQKYSLEIALVAAVQQFRENPNPHIAREAQDMRRQLREG